MVLSWIFLEMVHLHTNIIYCWCEFWKCYEPLKNITDYLALLFHFEEKNVFSAVAKDVWMDASKHIVTFSLKSDGTLLHTYLHASFTVHMNVKMYIHCTLENVFQKSYLNPLHHLIGVGRVNFYWFGSGFEFFYFSWVGFRVKNNPNKKFWVGLVKNTLGLGLISGWVLLNAHFYH